MTTMIERGARIIDPEAFDENFSSYNATEKTIRQNEAILRVRQILEPLLNPSNKAFSDGIEAFDLRKGPHEAMYDAFNAIITAALEESNE